MASYLYYHHETSAITDPEFDAICARLSKEWTKVKHPHKKLITKADLDAGTGYAIPLVKYPRIVQCAAWHWHDSLHPDARQVKPECGSAAKCGEESNLPA